MLSKLVVNKNIVSHNINGFFTNINGGFTKQYSHQSSTFDVKTYLILLLFNIMLYHVVIESNIIPSFQELQLVASQNQATFTFSRNLDEQISRNSCFELPNLTIMNNSSFEQLFDKILSNI